MKSTMAPHSSFLIAAIINLIGRTTLAQVDFTCPLVAVAQGGRNHTEYCCTDVQCKSTICYQHECKCKSLGGACSRNVECCSGNCNPKTKKCDCGDKLGNGCFQNSDCCVGHCTSDQTCGPKNDGASCTINSDCASKMCNANGLCGCKRAHEACYNDADCCPEGGVVCSPSKRCIGPGDTSAGVSPKEPVKNISAS